MNNKSPVIAAVLLLLAAAFFVSAVRMRGAIKNDYETTYVLVATRDLPAGAVVKADYVETMPVPRLYKQEDAYEVRSPGDEKLVNNLVAAVRVPKGNQLLRSCMLVRADTQDAKDGTTQAQLHYIEGVKHFQNSDYARARQEWELTIKLDPANAEAAAGLHRIDRILNPGN